MSRSNLTRRYREQPVVSYESIKVDHYGGVYYYDNEYRLVLYFNTSGYWKRYFYNNDNDNFLYSVNCRGVLTYHEPSRIADQHNS